MAESAVYSTETLRESNARTFKSMEGVLDKQILQGLQNMGFEYMTPVQEKCLTELPSLSSDCLVQAKTGTGKTIAFLLPALQNLLSRTRGRTAKSGVSILIVAPTRELVLQIAKECDQVTASLGQSLICHTAVGGTARASNLNKMKRGNASIVVATPGRLNDYLNEPTVRPMFENLQTLILDEADRMLDQGFLPAIKEMLRKLPPKREGWQGMCFSATMPKGMDDVLKSVLFPGYTELSTIDKNEVPTVDRVPQFSVVVPNIKQIFGALYAVIQNERKLFPSDDFKVIIFGTTANGTALLYALFKELFPDLKVFQLQSRLTQTARTRTTAEFKEASSGLMFASDVIGRGLDFPNVGLVIQLGLPASAEQYVHRVGRTARAGKEGRAITILHENESFFVKINKELPIQPYPTDLSSTIQSSADIVGNCFAAVEENAKNKAYTAFMGFNKTFLKKMRLDNEGLVKLANDYAETMGCPEPPMVDKKIVGKMGLKGTRGLRIGTVRDEDGERQKQSRVKPAPAGSYVAAATDAPSKRNGGGLGRGRQNKTKRHGEPAEGGKPAKKR